MAPTNLITKKSPGECLFHDLREDLSGILQYENKPSNLKSLAWAIFGSDAYPIMILFRIRMWARKFRIPVIGRLLRGLQTALYGIELGSEISLGHGVYFIHSVGIVIGGDSKVGDRCVFMGSNTIGAARFDGKGPVLGERVIVGAGARILGPINIGPAAIVGANAVVVKDIPAASLALGIPAISKPRVVE